MVTPAPPGSRLGNRITALRWKRLLTELGQTVRLTTHLGPHANCDLLVALHARKSFPAIAAFKSRHPDRPLVVALTGTDLYDDLPRGNADIASSLLLADQLIVLQPKALERVPGKYRSKTNVVLQSVAPRKLQPPNRFWRRLVGRLDSAKRRSVFAVAVLGHLRDVKDPLRTAEAVRGLPETSRVHVVHLGAATTPVWKKAAEMEMKRNPRYHWLGDVPHAQALQVLRRCRLLVVSSRLEGGANVVMEAIALGVPVLSSRIEGSVGILGKDYPGYYPFGDTATLSELIVRCESDAGFYTTLKKHCQQLRALTSPGHERSAWRKILTRCFPGRK